MRHFLTAAALLLSPLSALAAAPSLDGLASLPVARLPAAEIRSAIEAQKGEPLRYAVGHALNLDQRSGQWDEPSAGLARWRLRLASAGARSLSLELRDVVLPEGAELWLAGADGGDRQGPFTAASPSLRDGVLWLPVVRAEEALLEVTLPAAGARDLRLGIARAFHGYRPLRAEPSPDAAPGKAAIGSESGSCNVNVSCTAGNSWRNEIRATVLLSFDGGTICSGTLMNNTRQDERPLILTANHCGIRSSNVDTVIAYFNVESSACGSNNDGRVDQNLAGASFLARDSQSDFTLFTLAGVVPGTFNALYAGWDARSSSTPQSGASIHHPRGDEKKIAITSTPATRVEDAPIEVTGGTFTVDAWQVRWAQGTTEQGSSGSALWNQDHRVVGVLSGGDASCSNRSGPDLFARLERAWTANSASNGQLRAHLDAANTGLLTLDSKQPGSSSPLPPTDPVGDDGGGGAFTALALLLPALRRRRAI